MSNNNRHYNLYGTQHTSHKGFHIPYKRRIHKSGTGIIDFQKELLLISPFCKSIYAVINFMKYVAHLDGPVTLHKVPAIT